MVGSFPSSGNELVVSHELQLVALGAGEVGKLVRKPLCVGRSGVRTSVITSRDIEVIKLRLGMPLQ